MAPGPPAQDPDQAWAAVVAVHAGAPGITEGKAFSAPGLRVGGKIFAMRMADGLTVKLPADRCAALVAEGDAAPLRSGGRSMREWVTVGPSRAGEWDALAREALAFVRAALPA